MPFKKGESGNPKGKPKGTKNKTTIAGKETIANYFENGGLDDLLTDIALLDDRDRVNAKIKLIEYYIPKQKEVDIKGEFKNDTVNVTFTKIDTPPITNESQLFDDD
jgi:hypothetical protein